VLAVFADEDVRNDFLDELVELPNAPIYLRVQVTAPDGTTSTARFD
jgi:hypothetical protein